MKYGHFKSRLDDKNWLRPYLSKKDIDSVKSVLDKCIGSSNNNYYVLFHTGWGINENMSSKFMNEILTKQAINQIKARMQGKYLPGSYKEIYKKKIGFRRYNIWVDNEGRTVNI